MIRLFGKKSLYIGCLLSLPWLKFEYGCILHFSFSVSALLPCHIWQISSAASIPALIEMTLQCLFWIEMGSSMSLIFINFSSGMPWLFKVSLKYWQMLFFTFGFLGRCLIMRPTQSLFLQMRLSKTMEIENLLDVLTGQRIK